MSYPESIDSRGEALVTPGAFAAAHGRNTLTVWPNFLVGQDDKPVRVILIDDDEHMQRVVAQELMLDARTLLVGMASSVKEGRRLIKQHEFDVMLVDVNLNDGLGYSLIELMKFQRPSAEAIMFSIMESDEQVLRAFEVGATGYLVKHSWFGNYPQAVLQVANGGAYITPHLARRLIQKFDARNGTSSARSESSGSRESELLSQREKEVLRNVANGYTSAEIATRLEISMLTVNSHIKNIYRKLRVRTRAQAVQFASLRKLF
ncbi:LuxR C-terminal-related transcriptional regulator [Diaphorobacter aerolatus]|uniref:Response regulator transcription factor n=1 Tax=Diaphorobacter aerolatus TaxID=1288495 RepID=A0A7H0GKT3_9BURK|nr:response regulator transcription factor [Diaphorobacter aerolatus]QNP48899.1 response regulator transcription factor [Diaphorobacter aerolatus]